MNGATTVGDEGEENERVSPRLHSIQGMDKRGGEEVRADDVPGDDDVVLTLSEDHEDVVRQAEAEIVADELSTLVDTNEADLTQSEDEILAELTQTEDEIIAEELSTLSDSDVAALTQTEDEILAEELSTLSDSDVALRRQPSVTEDDEAKSRNERVTRLYHLVRADGFKGRRWDELVTVMAQYGMGVMDGWLRSGEVFRLLRARRRGVEVTESDRIVLRNDDLLREALVNAVVSAALKQFRQAARDGRGWSKDGGAEITTYFMNTCLLVFGNEWRTWKRKNLGKWRDHEHTSDPTEIHGYTEQDLRPPEVLNPTAEKIVHREDLARIGNILRDDYERTIIFFVVQGWTKERIADELGTSTKQIEKVLRRIRRRLRSQMEGNSNG